jgi:hypothetical protein
MGALQLDLFSEPPAPPVVGVPFEARYSVNPNKVWQSYAGIRVRQNTDGTWDSGTDYCIHMYCGGGGPLYGSLPTFEAALERALARLLSSCRHTAFNDISSCCGKAQIADATKLVEWLEGLASEHGLTMPERGQPFPPSMLGYSA